MNLKKEMEDLKSLSDQILKQNKAVLSDFKTFLAKTIEEQVSIAKNAGEDLKIDLNGILKDIKDLNVPDEVRVIKTVKYDFKDRTRRFFIFTTLISSILIFSSLIFFYESYRNRRATTAAKLSWRLKKFEDRIKIDKNGFYYLEFEDSGTENKGYTQNWTEFDSQFRNGEYDHRIRVYLGQK